MITAVNTSTPGEIMWVLRAWARELGRHVLKYVSPRVGFILEETEYIYTLVSSSEKKKRKIIAVLNAEFL